MSSIEISELMGKQYAHVMRDIRSLLEQGVHESNFGLMYRINKLGNGAERKLQPKANFAEELTKLIFNYASLIDEDSIVAFKEDLCVVSTFCDELDKISPIDYENYVATQNK